MKYERLKTLRVILAAAIFGFVLVSAWGEDLGVLIADRAAVERVYYSHRTGTKAPFEETLPPALLERLVKLDLKKEAVLKKVYGVEIPLAQVNAEVQRINATTRAPEVLAELKAALGGDAARFAETVARPIIVERELRRRFENDDALHAVERKHVEQTRNDLLAAKKAAASPEKLFALLKAGKGSVQEIQWQLTARPAEPAKPDELEIKKKFGESAQIISPPGDPKDKKFYFEDLEPELRNVLQAQLRQAGDVSAVIEMPTGFLLYLVQAKTPETLSVAALVLPKRGYEAWLDEQTP